jgi:hypothetical protein
VLDKNSDYSVLGIALAHLRLNLIGDFVKSLAMGAHFELVVMHMHARSRYFSVVIGAKQRAEIPCPPFLDQLSPCVYVYAG